MENQFALGFKKLKKKINVSAYFNNSSKTLMKLLNNVLRDIHITFSTLFTNFAVCKDVIEL